MDLHLFPGFFGDLAGRFLGRLAEGDRLRARECVGRLGEESIELADFGACRDWLGGVQAGETRRVSSRGRVGPGPETDVAFEAYGASRTRILLGVTASPVEGGGLTWADVEIALLGMACTSLEGEDQGAAALGFEFGPVGAGLRRGTVADQVRDFLELNGDRTKTLVLAPGSARSVGDLPGFTAETLGDLVMLRAAAG